MSGTQLQGADLRDAKLWRATSSDYPPNLKLADLRGADFRKPLTKEEEADLRQSLASMSEATRTHVAKKLRGVLMPEGPEPDFVFTASHSLPVLVSDPPDPMLTAHREWLITTPTSAYTDALAKYLADEVAPLDPIIAAQILNRAEHGLVDPYVMSPKIAETIICHLVANRELGIKQVSMLMDGFSVPIKSAELSCPAPPAAGAESQPRIRSSGAGRRRRD